MDTEMQKFLDGVIGVVDANNYEHLCLWEENKKYSIRTWQEQLGGLLEKVGELDGMPVCISLRVDIVGGQKILFMYPTSMVVDHRLIDKWLEKNMPKTAYGMKYNPHILNRTDAMNFSNIFYRNQNDGR